jgi:L-threonylcarbamoyladenylate synthase
MTARIAEATSATLAEAADLLRGGKLVAFPTETVYGLGGDATNDQAVAAIFAAKGRPHFNPLIIHVADITALDELIIWNETARLLAQQFWPGPLTLVLPRHASARISLLASAGLDTLAVRVPSHPVAQQLLKIVGRPIAAPSANASGKLSPTTPLHVAESLGDKVDMILASGKTNVGIESTVLDLTTLRPTLLRPGGVTKEALEIVLGPIDDATHTNPDKPASPGMLASHYAPHLPLRMNAESAAPDEGLLTFGADFLIKGGATRLNLSPDGDLQEAAANLFAMLRQLDQPHLKGIAVMPIPSNGLGLAINDRLTRACVR